MNQQDPHRAITAAQLAAQTARAASVFDAIDQQAERLTSHDRYDYAYSTWEAFVEIDQQLLDEDIARIAIRAARHMPEEAIIDLVDVQYGEHEKRIRFDDGSGLVWLPDDDTLILTYPLSRDRAVDAVLSRPAKLRA